MDRRFIFEEAEKEHFTRLMREYEAFCQVRVLKYCVMSNHYHVLTQDPKDYRWCGYGEAVAGIRIAKEGFKSLMNARDGVEDSLTAAMATYRVWLFGQGEQNEGLDEQGRPVRRGIDPERVQEVIVAKGKLRIHCVLQGSYLNIQQFNHLSEARLFDGVPVAKGFISLYSHRHSGVFRQA